MHQIKRSSTADVCSNPFLEFRMFHHIWTHSAERLLRCFFFVSSVWCVIFSLSLRYVYISTPYVWYFRISYGPYFVLLLLLLKIAQYIYICYKIFCLYSITNRHISNIFAKPNKWMKMFHFFYHLWLLWYKPENDNAILLKHIDYRYDAMMVW